MGWGTAIRVSLSDYVVFSRRASRPEYWGFILFAVLLTLAAAIFDSLLGGKVADSAVWLFLLLPNLAVSVRRLHDLDRTGWWLLLGLVPLIGAIVLLIWFFRRGKPETNRFGPPPHEEFA